MDLLKLAYRLPCLGLLICSFALSSCATTRALQPLAAPGEGRAVVYFIRQHYPPYVYGLRVSVNGQLAATIANDDVVAVNVPVGLDFISLDITQGRPYSFHMRVKKPGYLYVVLTGAVTGAGTYADPSGVTVNLNWNLGAYRVTRNEAEAIVAKLGKRLD